MSEEAKTEDDEIAMAEQALLAARKRHGLPATPAKDPMEMIRTLCERGIELAEAARLRGEPDPCDPPPRQPLCYADRIVPPFARKLRLDDEALRARVERKEAIGETRKALLAQKPKIVFVGVSGSGKTSLAAAALHEYIGGLRYRPVVSWLKARDVAYARTRQPLGQGDPAILEVAIGSDLVIIDDLGQDPPPRSFQTNLLPDIVLERYDRKGPLWVATWLSLAEMVSRYGEGFARRVLEGAKVIQCGYELIPMSEDQ